MLERWAKMGFNKDLHSETDEADSSIQDNPAECSSSLSTVNNSLPPPYPPPEIYEKQDQIITIMSLEVQNKVSCLKNSFFFL